MKEWKKVTIEEVINTWPEIKAWYESGPKKLWQVVVTLLCYDMYAKIDTLSVVEPFKLPLAKFHKQLAWIWGNLFNELMLQLTIMGKRDELLDVDYIHGHQVGNLRVLEKYFPHDLAKSFYYGHLWGSIDYYETLTDLDVLTKKYNDGQYIFPPYPNDGTLTTSFDAFVAGYHNREFLTIKEVREHLLMALRTAGAEYKNKIDLIEQDKDHEIAYKLGKERIRREIRNYLVEFDTKDMFTSDGRWVENYRTANPKKALEKLHGLVDSALKNANDEKDVLVKNLMNRRFKRQKSMDYDQTRSEIDEFKEEVKHLGLVKGDLEKMAAALADLDIQYSTSLSGIKQNKADLEALYNDEVTNINKEYKMIIKHTLSDLIKIEYDVIGPRAQYYINPTSHLMDFQRELEHFIVDFFGGDYSLTMCVGTKVPDPIKKDEVVIKTTKTTTNVIPKILDVTYTPILFSGPLHIYLVLNSVISGKKRSRTYKGYDFVYSVKPPTNMISNKSCTEYRPYCSLKFIQFVIGTKIDSHGAVEILRDWYKNMDTLEVEGSNDRFSDVLMKLLTNLDPQPTPGTTGISILEVNDPNIKKVSNFFTKEAWYNSAGKT